MAKRNEHLVVIMLEPINFNVEFEVWPQHITIVPWFAVEDEEYLDEVLQKVASRHSSFEVISGPKELWGNKEKYEVVVMNDYTGKLHELHLDVFDNLEKNGFLIHQKDFLGVKYRPHVTVRNQLQKEERQIWNGQPFVIKQFSLISQVRLKKSGRMIKRVKKNYELAQ